MPNITRRSFLKVSAGLMVTSSGVSFPLRANAQSVKGLCSLIDLSLCDGCPDRTIPACVAACKERALERVPDPVETIPRLFPRGKVEDWSERKEVWNRLTPYNHIFVQRAEVEFNNEKRTVFIPRRCMHCDNPACATICPFAANHKAENGAVLIDPDLCFGGAKCRDVCPWNIPQRQSGMGIYLHIAPSLAGNGVMYKCDFCYDRLLEQKIPLCMDACPRNAMIIGLEEDIHREAERRAVAMKGYVYGRQENGGTGTLYLSPVPFELLDDAIEKSSGRPHMKRVGRRLEEARLLEGAVLLAPIIGIGSGIAAAIRKRKIDESEDE